MADGGTAIFHTKSQSHEEDGSGVVVNRIGFSRQAAKEDRELPEPEGKEEDGGTVNI